MLKLPQVTVVALAGVNIYATVKALAYSSKNIKFGRVLLISHNKPWYLPRGIDYEYTTKSEDVYEWCYKIVYELHNYIKTEYAILIHSDGFIVNSEQWRDEFLNYDYIGAPWPIPGDNSYRDIHGNLIRVGNSVSLRSKRILELPSELNLPWEPRDGYFHEDGFLCCNNRHILIENGIKFSPLDVAKYFSHETMIPEIRGIRPFAFHKWAGSNHEYPGYWTNRLLRRW
jgi:hypothetical protein